jgi:quercetin dioxygenase-like cupin family protein
MAYPNKIIRNSVTGQDIQFIKTGRDTNGELLEMITTYNAQSKEPVPHYHPYQEEDFTVLEGELTVKINGQLRLLKQGDQLHIAKNEVHGMWNASQHKTVVNWKVQPALHTEHLLETGTGLANDDKLNKAGMPHILQVALMANKFKNEFRLSKPPFLLQRILFALLTPFAYIAGYKPTYKKYLD